MPSEFEDIDALPIQALNLTELRVTTPRTWLLRIRCADGIHNFLTDDAGLRLLATEIERRIGKP